MIRRLLRKIISIRLVRKWLNRRAKRLMLEGATTLGRLNEELRKASRRDPETIVGIDFAHGCQTTVTFRRHADGVIEIQEVETSRLTEYEARVLSMCKEWRTQRAAQVGLDKCAKYVVID